MKGSNQSLVDVQNIGRIFRILIYTFGMGSGHLSRVNAIIKGFQRNEINFEISVYAPRSKYIRYLSPEAVNVTVEHLPESVDIFICDWKADKFVDSLNSNYASLWVGLRRLGTIKSTFPKRFLIFAIEPEVPGDILIWPIISTWRDELVSKQEFKFITQTNDEESVALLCENGAFTVHPEKVLIDHQVDSKFKKIRCSNNDNSSEYRDLDYYPVARLFPWPQKLVIGAGYNSLHEAMCFANPLAYEPVYVGGDDQKKRLQYYLNWVDKCPKDSQADKLTRVIVREFNEKSLWI